MDSFWWFMVTAILASLMTGALTSAPYGSVVFVMLIAIRNAVMAGYVEGRLRYPRERDARNRALRRQGIAPTADANAKE